MGSGIFAVSHSGEMVENGTAERSVSCAGDVLRDILCNDVLAIRYKWEMPKFVFNGEEK